MCKRNFFVIGGIVFCVLLGVLLHFAYEWSGNNKFVGYFSAVNESTFEHLKLLFFPVLIYTVFEWLKWGRKNLSFLLSRALSLIVGMLWIVVSFYTISGIIGKTDMPVINIAIFVMGVIITFLLTQLLMKSFFNPPRYSNIIAVAILLALAIMFAFFTYNPLPIGLFKEP